jgi:hypothetical protein
MQTAQQGCQQSLIAVGRFNENLGFTGFHCVFFQRLNSLQTQRCILRQIADEGELLPVQTAGR